MDIHQDNNELINKINHYEKMIKRLTKENEFLDRKIGNMVFIYGEIGKMFEELSKDKITELALKCFSEFTESEFTTLFLKDEITRNFDLVSYQCKNEQEILHQFSLYPSQEGFLYMPTYVDVSEDSQRDIIKNQFYNGNDLFVKVRPRYIIAIKSGNSLRGFITFDENFGAHQEKEIFQIIESLGKAMYVVFNTASNFAKIETQKNTLKIKLKKMMDLSALAKIVNSVTSIDTVISLIASALKVSYNSELAFIALYDSDKMVLNIEASINMKGVVKEIPMKGALLPLLLGEKIIVVEEHKVSNLFEDMFIQEFIKAPSGACIIPIYIEEYDTNLIGAIGVLGLEKGILAAEEHVMAFEFMANHIAPIIYHIKRVEKIKEEYHPNYYHAFLEALKSNIVGADIFSLELYVIWVSYNGKLELHDNPFKMRAQDQFRDIYFVDNQNTLILTTDYEDIELVDHISSKEETVVAYKCKKDFNSVEEFVELFRT
ncbi:MAG: hypothetical protein CVV02_06990 [Firmicutes bacterium HGW-Firmicutes-7]|nr:MAG: hypothetical protein CVV02_06990 [Firmicutes bacterium HGW-Firmicutes-7]